MSTIRRVSIAIVVLAFIVLGAMAMIRRNFVWEREIDSQLLWSNTEGYFIVARQREGWSGSLLSYGWQVVRVRVGLPAARTDRRRWLEVTKITPAEALKIVVPDSNALAAGVFEDHIYLAVDHALVRWDGDRYVAVNADESQRFNRERRGTGEFREIDGWSAEINIVRGSPGASNYPISFDGGTVNIEVKQEAPHRSAIARFSDNTSTTLLELTDEASQVDSHTYRSLFEGPLMSDKRQS